jgi:hypothetical protein
MEPSRKENWDWLLNKDLLLENRTGLLVKLVWDMLIDHKMLIRR